MKVFVYGAGGHGKVVADILIAGGRYEVAGFLDDNPSLYDSTVMGLIVAGGETWLRAWAGKDKVAIALGLGDNKIRKELVGRCRGIEIINAVHPHTAVSRFARLGEGTVVMAGAVINPDASVGCGVIINSGAVIEHDVVIGDYAHVSPNAAMGGAARLGDESHLGLGAVILPGIAVGKRTVIGAGAVAIRDLPDDVVASGVPARIHQ
jgi:sugar O-acyltransferase (sialic acid O-acetyltransferase NeuD family)